MITVECYRATIECNDKGVRVYFFNTIDKGGDTELILQYDGVVVLRKENKRGQMV